MSNDSIIVKPDQDEDDAIQSNSNSKNKASQDVDEYQDPEGYYPKRFQFALLTLFSNLICYADRTAIGVVILHLSLSSSETGYVLASFFIGYCLTQILAGWASERYGGKLVLIAGVLTWTLFDLLTIPAGEGVNAASTSASTSTSTSNTSHLSAFYALILIRMGVGFGQGVNFPVVHHMSALWFPRAERTRLVALLMSGQDLGTICALLLTPQLASHVGWQFVFVFFALLAIIWFILFSYMGAGSPDTHPTISPYEKEYIISTREDHGSGHHIHVTQTLLTDHIDPEQQDHDPVEHRHSVWSLLGYFLGKSSTWAIFIAHIAYSYGWFLLLSWSPRFITQVLNSSLTGSGSVVLVLPYIIGYVGMLESGWTSDYLIFEGWRVGTVRKLMNSIGNFGPAICFILLAISPTHLTQVETTILLSVLLFTLRHIASGFWVNVLDVAGPHAGLLLGLSLTFSNIPAVVCNVLTGYFLGGFPASSAWSISFLVAAAVHVVGGLVFLIWADDQPLKFEGLDYIRVPTSAKDIDTEDDAVKAQ